MLFLMLKPFFVRNIRLILKCMVLQPHEQTITIHIVPNISRGKGNQTMAFGRVIEYSERNIFLKNHAENEAGRLAPDLFFSFKKVLFELKSSGLQLT